MIRPIGRVLWRAFQRFTEHNGPDRAAAVAYYTLLSLLPLLVFLISIGVLVLGSFEAAYKGTLFLIGGVVMHLDDEALVTLRAFVEHATRLQWPGLILLAWTSRRIFASLFSALERVFGVPGRSIARHNLLALSMVLVTGVAVLLTMAFTMLIATSEGLFLRFRASGAFQNLVPDLVTTVFPILITFSFFFVIYRLVPRRVVSHRYAAIGALCATTLWELAKSGFAYYVRNLARYSGVYGTLEGVIVLAIWLEISVSIVLYCGEIVAILITPKRLQRRIPFASGTPLTPISTLGEE